VANFRGSLRNGKSKVSGERIECRDAFPDVPIVKFKIETEKMIMKLPTIHLNGTSANALEQQVDAAIDALCLARAALIETAPNARDYYPQGQGAISQAGVEVRNRLLKLDDVAKELNELQEHIETCVRERNRERQRA